MYEKHIEGVVRKVAKRNCLLRKLMDSNWDAKPSVLPTTAQALCFSAAEHCSSVWNSSNHTKVDGELFMPCIPQQPTTRVTSLRPSPSSNTRSKTVLTVQEEMFSKSVSASRITRLEKALLLLTFLLTLADVPLVTYAKGSNHQVGKRQRMTQDTDFTCPAAVCLSSECVLAADGIKSKLDESVNPCDDFYQFSCGAFLTERVIPDDVSRIGTFKELSSHVAETVNKLLESDILPSDRDYIKKIKTYYASCMRYDHINHLGVQPLNDFINREFGGWPLTNSNWQESSFNRTQLILKLSSYSIYPLLAVNVDVDLMNSSKNTISIQQYGLTLPKTYYNALRNDTILMALEEVIYKYGMTLGLADVNTARQEVKDVVDLEIELASISVSDEDRYYPEDLLEQMTLAEISQQYSQIMDWKRYIYTKMNLPRNTVTDVTDDEIIINKTPSYFENLSAVLNNTPKRTLVNYMIWNALKELHYTQGQVLDDVMRELTVHIGAPKKRPPRQKFCFKRVEKNMGLALSKMFVDNYFDPEAKEITLQMASSIQSILDNTLDTNTWLDRPTTLLAMEKNQAMGHHVGYPEYIMDETYMTELYNDLSFQPSNFMENSLNIHREDALVNVMDLRTPVSSSEVTYYPTDVNAYYEGETNSLQFPAGILQPPFFNKRYPKYLNFGGIGMVIGHEMIHAFDELGRNFDKDGNWAEWWTDEALAIFNNKTQCLANQYSNYTVESVGMNIDGRRTLCENMADNGGLKLAYRAYRQWVSRNGEEKPLPGLRYTPDQLFFINFGQLWCRKVTESYMTYNMLNGFYSPTQFRVNGPVRNLEDFNRVFSCPQNSAMNPQDKCILW